MKTRRDFLAQSMLAAGVWGVSPAALIAAASKDQKPPTRFIFLHKGNGLLPGSLVPPTFNKRQLEVTE